MYVNSTHKTHNNVRGMCSTLGMAKKFLTIERLFFLRKGNLRNYTIHHLDSQTINYKIICKDTKLDIHTFKYNC